MAIKPILFNTDMVRAILDGRKTATRRAVKNYGKPPEYYGRKRFYELRCELNGDARNLWAGFYKDSDVFYVDGEKHIDAIYFKSPCKVNDILYVQESFWKRPSGNYSYRADYTGASDWKWRPSIHMPREAARIFLRVTDVWVERLRDITEYGDKREGASLPQETINDPEYADYIGGYYSAFGELWDSTIKKSDRAVYGWAANPWVWVIEFERCGKPDGWTT